MEQINENFETTLLHSKFHQRLHSHINSIFEHFYVFTLRLVKQKGELDLNTLNMNDHGMFGRTSTDTHTRIKTTIPAFFVVYFFLWSSLHAIFFRLCILRCSRLFEYSLRCNICDNNPMFDIELECFCWFAYRHIFICHNISNVSVFGSFSSLFLFN